MALSPLIKHIYSSGAEEVIRRGKRIFLTGGVQLVKKDEFTGQITFKVKNDMYYNQYNVTISKFHDTSTLSARCSCPYNMGEICRHEAAALFQLNDMIVNQTLNASQAVFDQKHTMIRMKVIDLKLLRLFTSTFLFEEAEKISQKHKAKIISAINEKVEAVLEYENETFQLIIKRNDDKSFDTSCTCSETRHALCKHKAALFLQLLNNYGPTYFDSIRNWESQKNKLLALYGYSLSDDLTGKFDFMYQDGKPILKVLDTTIKKVNAMGSQEIQKQEPEIESTVEKNYNKRLGIVINLHENDFPYFTIDLIDGELNQDKDSFVGTINKLDTSKYISPDHYPVEDRNILTLARKVQKGETAKYISRNSPFGDLWENIVHEHTEWTQENKESLYEYLHPKLVRLFSGMHRCNPLYILPKGKAFKTASLKAVNYIDHTPVPVFEIKKEKSRKKNDFSVQTILSIDITGNIIPLSKNELANPLLYKFDDKIYLINKPQDAAKLSLLENDTKVDAASWPNYLQQKLLPLSKLYDVQFDNALVEYHHESVPIPHVYLGEHGAYFSIRPLFKYGNVIADWNDEQSVSSYDNGKLVIIHRNKEAEEKFILMLQGLHPHLRVQDIQHQFAIHSKYALQKNWFFLFFDKMKEEKVEVYGYNELKQFKIHKARPTTKLHVASNVDWFDTEVEVDFDGQKASINDIQKALAVKQNYVQLGDGTYGLLPEEWLQKFSLLFKMGDSNGKSIRVNKFNFSVIDALHDMIDDEEVKKELMEKSEILLNTNPEKYSHIPIPTQLQATLRPYQEAGFRWLTYLDSVKWGGLLADDMGLGKTIQTLSFLQHYKNENGALRALVICPTTLLFNWENEIVKFTPELTYIKHHGMNRTANVKDFEPYNIIISTYGTLRSDVTLFSKHSLDYVILDESQTIKNPSSKVAKAAQLLVCKNRIALSGTPMQNNTFDIFSQMHFLNPGMLGSKDFFREQFAKPVDKFQDEETKQHLRKLIYPFLLRRTKEQVAQDLPEKTEITLYCEMGKEQRSIYESYKDLYRSKILGTIDQQGIEKSQFAILQGLMKLRQICDSPAILNEVDKYENHSAKLDELVRELEENTGNHKVLVFSQFLGMLALIREKLKEHGIAYQYFDGSYTAQQRENAIQEFQNNEDCPVFLISLKAGGMGLNLTAADYVYIVDPWWNPAVEQQAIDRTHRIGQTKNIFAYRFICKDTVEEKIMLLKEKKNLLVKDIISDDNNMVKQLSRDDIAYLFS
ncbi:MAG: DEAD/DEAH box helicase family protein [Bacteroidetes bacterium]|nr:DEAD/DEAH box helicase family protein [Bacteroidota bacterium]